MFLKRPREQDEDYLKYIRGLGCAVCPKDAEPHHLVTVKNFGSDYTCIPLCREHHTEFHTKGKLDFNKKYRCDAWKIAHKALLDYFKKREA